MNEDESNDGQFENVAELCLPPPQTPEYAGLETVTESPEPPAVLPPPELSPPPAEDAAPEFPEPVDAPPPPGPPPEIPVPTGQPGIRPSPVF